MLASHTIHRSQPYFRLSRSNLDHVYRRKAQPRKPVVPYVLDECDCACCHHFNLEGRWGPDVSQVGCLWLGRGAGTVRPRGPCSCRCEEQVRGNSYRRRTGEFSVGRCVFSERSRRLWRGSHYWSSGERFYRIFRLFAYFLIDLSNISIVFVQCVAGHYRLRLFSGGDARCHEPQ